MSRDKRVMVEELNSSSDSDTESEEESEGHVRGLPPQSGTDVTNNTLSLVDDTTCILVRQPANLNEELPGEGDDEQAVKAADLKTNQISSAISDNLKRKKRKRKFLFVCLTSCKYDSVRRASQLYGFKEVSDEEDWTLYWTDLSVSLERVMDMKKYQKINHFPGMSEICRKDLLARNMNRMLRSFPKEYNIFPKSWCLPADYAELQSYARQKKGKTYILKPESGCQGRGIWVTRFPREIKPNEHMLCQQYLSRPLLVDGFKFDMRVYALVTAIDPLRIFVFKDGLGRFATNKYVEPHSSNVSNVFMHLTNYAINKNSNDFIRDDEAGSKRRLSTVNKWLQEHGYDVGKIWADIDDLIIKTLISALAVLKHNYRTCFPNYIGSSTCFEILGFDVILDRKGKPFLLEVNHSPSFTTDSALDVEIKDTLLYDTLNLVNFDSVDRRKYLEEERKRAKERLFQKQNRKESKEELDKLLQAWLSETTAYEDSHMGNFRRIYPSATSNKYDMFFQSSNVLFQETATYKARFECARQQREELVRKQEKADGQLKKRRDLVRPESPATRPRRTRAIDARTSVKMSATATNKSELSDGKPGMGAYMDSLQPLVISEEDELERIRGLLQRENLIRGLGIVEHVYRILQAPLSNKSDSNKLYQSDQQLYQRQLPNGQDGRINVLGTAIARGGVGSFPLAMAPPYSQQFAQLGLHTGLAPVAGWSDVLPSTVPKQAKDTRLMPLRTPPYKPHQTGIHTRVAVLANDFLPVSHRPSPGPLIRLDDPRLESAYSRKKVYVDSQHDSSRR